MKYLAAFLLGLLFAPLAVQAQSIDTKAAQALLIDFDTGSVLLSKEADAAMHPSSMSKLMTTYVLYNRIKDGRVHLTDTFPVSEKAWRMQGSKMFVHVGDRVPVEDLLRGIVIQSGNDACIVVAEGISGSEDAFAQEMNRYAQTIGLQHSHFTNATGWPDEQHLMSARDLAVLATHIIREFPEDYHFYSEKSFSYNNITQPNRNRLLGNDIGVDGLKTGHTDAGGYGIVLSAKHPQSGRRLLLVINGLASDNDRMEEGDRLLRWGFREFENKTIAKSGEVIDSVPVWLGQKDEVTVAAADNVALTLPINAAQNMSFKLAYNGPVAAPIAKGAQVAELVVSAPGQEERRIPLVATEDVGRIGGVGKIWRTLKAMVGTH